MSGRAMSLFIGRLSDNTTVRDLEDAFKKYGKLNRCDVKSGNGNTFGFVSFSDERDAEEALERMNGFELNGSRINVEWAKESGRSSRKDFNCYNCGKPGHIARNCRDRRSSRSRSRSPPRRSRRSRSRSGSRGRRGRSRSRSRSAERSSRSHRSRDHAPRERSRSRSPRRRSSSPKPSSPKRRSPSPRKRSRSPSPR